MIKTLDLFKGSFGGSFRDLFKGYRGQEIDRLSSLPGFDDISSSEISEIVEAEMRAIPIAISERWFGKSASNLRIPINQKRKFFLESYFPSWRGGFVKGFIFNRRQKRPYKSGHFHRECQYPYSEDYKIAQSIALQEAYKEHQWFLGQKQEDSSETISFDEVMEDFNKHHIFPWASGFRIGYCGKSCVDRFDCEIGKKYVQIKD